MVETLKSARQEGTSLNSSPALFVAQLSIATRSPTNRRTVRRQNRGTDGNSSACAVLAPKHAYVQRAGS